MKRKYFSLPSNRSPNLSILNCFNHLKYHSELYNKKNGNNSKNWNENYILKFNFNMNTNVKFNKFLNLFNTNSMLNLNLFISYSTESSHSTMIFNQFYNLLSKGEYNEILSQLSQFKANKSSNSISFSEFNERINEDFNQSLNINSYKKNILELDRALVTLFLNENESIKHLRNVEFAKFIEKLRDETPTFMYLYAIFMKKTKKFQIYLLYIKKAAEMGHELSMWEYAYYLHTLHLKLEEFSLDKNYNTSNNLNNKLKNDINTEIENSLFKNKNDIVKEIEKIRKKVIYFLVKCVNLQDEKAIFLLADYYKHGWGLDKNKEETFRLRKLSIDQNYPNARFALAMDYLYFEDVYSCLSTLVEEANSDLTGKIEYTIGMLLLENKQVKDIAENAQEQAFRYLQLSVNKGNKIAAFTLANHLIETNFEEIDFSKIINLYKFASSEIGEAAYILGKFFEKGLGKYLSINPFKAFEYMKKAENLGYRKASTYLVEYYFKGFGVDKDEDKAEKLLNDLIADNIPRAFLVKYLVTKDIISDKFETLKFLVTSSALEDPEAQFLLASIILEGDDKIKPILNSLINDCSPHIAMDLIESSALQQYPPAMNEYGMMLLEANPNLAKKYFLQASSLGYFQALTNIGHILLEENRLNEAEYYFNKSIELCEEVNAMYNLARLFLRKNLLQYSILQLIQSCKKDSIQSFSLLGAIICSYENNLNFYNYFNSSEEFQVLSEISIDKIQLEKLNINLNEGFNYILKGYNLSKKIKNTKNYTDIQYNLGLCYFFGIGIEMDQNQGIQLILESADNDHPFAKAFLGWKYEQENDLIKSRYWQNEAKDLGLKEDNIKIFYENPIQFAIKDV